VAITRSAISAATEIESGPTAVATKTAGYSGLEAAADIKSTYTAAADAGRALAGNESEGWRMAKMPVLLTRETNPQNGRQLLWSTSFDFRLDCRLLLGIYFSWSKWGRR
jgi:hypothetical protein